MASTLVTYTRYLAYVVSISRDQGIEIKVLQSLVLTTAPALFHADQT